DLDPEPGTGYPLPNLGLPPKQGGAGKGFFPRGPRRQTHAGEALVGLGGPDHGGVPGGLQLVLRKVLLAPRAQLPALCPVLPDARVLPGQPVSARLLHADGQRPTAPAAPVAAVVLKKSLNRRPHAPREEAPHAEREAYDPNPGPRRERGTNL